MTIRNLEHERLTAAVNLLSEYVRKNLAPGFMLSLEMRPTESRIILIDNDSESIDVFVYPGDCAVVVCCDASKELTQP